MVTSAPAPEFLKDKMDTIHLFDAPREGKEAFAAIDIASYTKHTFGMFGGEKQRVTLEFSNGLSGVVVDRFGKDVPFIRTDSAHFMIHVDVTVSAQFYGWLFALGSDARILEPTRVADGMKGQLSCVAGLY